MKSKKFISVSVLFVLLFLNNVNTIAQCAMCKSSVESTLKTGESVAGGLNTGILYLMGIPYFILIIGGYFFFKKPIDAKIKVWKKKYY